MAKAIADRHDVDKDAKDSRKLGLAGRAFLLAMLFSDATRADLVSFTNPGTSIVTTVYAGALLVMAGSLVLFWRNFTSDAARTGANPNADETRLVFGLFSEAWYEAPAVFCMLLSGTQFISNLLAEPPESVKAKWFLASFVLLLLASAAHWLMNRAQGKSKERPGTGGSTENGWPRTGPLSDPGFRLPLVTYLLLSGAYRGVVGIDAEPSSIVAWVIFVIGPVLVIAMVAGLIVDSRRKAAPPRQRRARG